MASSRDSSCARSTRIHYDVAQFAGGKIPWLLYYLPIAVILTLVFEPTFDVRPAEVVVFAVAIWGAYLDPHVQPDRARDRLFLDDPRRCALLAVHRPRAAALRTARATHAHA